MRQRVCVEEGCSPNFVVICDFLLPRDQIYAPAIPQNQVFLALFARDRFPTQKRVAEICVSHVRRQRNSENVATQHRRACTCDHGTGRDFTRPPPFGTCTHR